jgi:hypothetical protein
MGGALYAKGIVIKVDGTTYKSQINSIANSAGQLSPWFSYEEGTYTLNTGVSPYTMEMVTTSSVFSFDVITGTWKKQ